MSDEAAAVQAANQAFYRAFEALDLAAMDAVWAHEGACTCLHPGWPLCNGWAQVRGGRARAGQRRRRRREGAQLSEALEPAATATVERDIAAAETLARWMDDRYLDPILGLLVPGIGDLIGSALGLYVVGVAVRRRLPL